MANHQATAGFAASKTWIKYSFLNTLEHGVTRGADALTSVLLLWTLSPEWFSKLAIAQTLVAPCLLFFISPESLIYREYAQWRSEGVSSLAAKVQALRRFGYLKGAVMLAVVFTLAMIRHQGGSASTSFAVRFWALLWAFTWVLTPQICGADREFLRLDLKLRELNFVSLYQKISMLLMSAAALAVWRDRPEVFSALAFAAVFSAISTALIARYLVRTSLVREGALSHSLQFWQFIWQSTRTFSFWQHLSGVVLVWVTSMDVFFLGLLRFPARVVGLYAAALKVANLSMALPIALSNIFTIWMGREMKIRDLSEERRGLWRYSGWIGLFLALQGLLIVALARPLLEVLSHGRWSLGELLDMARWLRWIILGSSLYGCALLLNSWMLLRAGMKRYFSTIFLPWALISLLTYFVAAKFHGPDGAAFANVIVSMAYLGLAGRFYYRWAPS